MRRRFLATPRRQCPASVSGATSTPT